MHLANGTISNDICTITAAVSTASILYAGARARTTATRSRIAKAAAGAGVVLVAQMIDVSLFGAVSVHMIGAAFLTLLAGPALALLAMAFVVVTQALFLGDGGITAIGANVLNMAVIGVATSYLTMALVRRRFHGCTALVMSAAAAAAVSVFAAVAAMSTELALSGLPVDSALAFTMPAHAPFAAWETVSTVVFVLAAAHVRVVRPLATSKSSSR
jgi:cobalt/nickel transport system permease protein